MATTENVTAENLSAEGPLAGGAAVTVLFANVDERIVLFGDSSHRLGQASRNRPELAADTDELAALTNEAARHGGRHRLIAARSPL